jgi:nucleotide-binding universal stress UspA family protein
VIKSILVATDASPHAMAARAQALQIARRYEARLVGLYVLDVRLVEMPPYLDYTYEGVPLTVMPLELLEGFRQKGERALNEFRAALSDAGITVEVQLEEGVPADTIVEVGEAHDLIVMGKRGEHARWGKELLGSTSESTIRRAATPVLLAEAEATTVERMLVMFDGSPAANHALKLAADLATRLGAGLRILTVGDDLDQAASVQEEARGYMEVVPLPVVYRLAEGEVVAAGLSEMEEEPVDMLVLGLKGHSFLHRLVLGSTAEQLMREAPVPVLLVP